MEVIARYADVWNGIGNDPDQWSEDVQRLTATCQRLDRERPILKEAQVIADRYLSSEESHQLRDHLLRLEAAGVDQVVVVLNHVRGPEAVERLAAVVL